MYFFYVIKCPPSSLQQEWHCKKTGYAARRCSFPPEQPTQQSFPETYA